jgi:hypothetical protein
MEITHFLLLIVSAASLDLVIILSLRKRNRPIQSSLGEAKPGMTLPVADQSKDAENEGSQEKTDSNSLEAQIIETPSKKENTLKSLLMPAASFLNSFPHIPFRFPTGEWLDILVILAVTVLYAYPLLIFYPGLGLPGREYQAHVGTVALLNQWLSGEINFPLWNPVIGTGRSLIADPFLFFFNPFLSLPMALFGIINGSKIAVVMNFFIAGVGMWFVAKELKFGRLTRLWCSLLYMMAGAIPAHLSAGHIQLTFALGWLPWSIAGLLWVINRSSLLSILFASLAQALFFFAGNLYYQIYAFFCLLILGFGFAFDWKSFHFKREVAKRISMTAILSVGLISIQLLPLLASNSDVRNLGGYLPDESEYFGSQRPEDAILNYFVSDLDFYRSTSLDKAPFPQESYRYIGVIPFLLLLFLVPTFRRGHHKEIILLGLCFLLMLAWASIRYSFVKYIYDLLPFLNQFRWPGRALSVGALFLILVSAFGLEYIWTSLRSKKPFINFHSDPNTTGETTHTYSIFSVLLVMALFLAMRHVYLNNQELIYLEKAYEPEIKVGLSMLSDNDSSGTSVYTSHAIAIKSALDVYELNLRSPTIVDGWIPSDSPLLLGNPEAIKLEPKYWLNWDSEEIDHSGHNLLAAIGSMQIWQEPDTYPYAFLVPIQDLLAADQILPKDVQPVDEVQRVGTNRVVVEADADPESVLIISESWFSGWKVSVDESPAELLSVSNLLAVQLSPGTHHIEFKYAPAAFTVGAIISGLTLLLMLLAFMREGAKFYIDAQTGEE